MIRRINRKWNVLVVDEDGNRFVRPFRGLMRVDR